MTTEEYTLEYTPGDVIAAYFAKQVSQDGDGIPPSWEDEEADAATAALLERGKALLETFRIHRGEKFPTTVGPLPHHYHPDAVASAVVPAGYIATAEQSRVVGLVRRPVMDIIRNVVTRIIAEGNLGCTEEMLWDEIVFPGLRRLDDSTRDFLYAAADAPAVEAWIVALINGGE